MRHIYNQSAGASAEAAAMYAQSEAEYLRKWGGITWKRLQRPLPARGERVAEGRVRGDVGKMVVEASPLPNFETAAGHFPKTWPIALPEEVLASYRGPALHLRVVDRRTGEVLAKIEP